jgi:hypothetical protein
MEYISYFWDKLYPYLIKPNSIQPNSIQPTHTTKMNKINTFLSTTDDDVDRDSLYILLEIQNGGYYRKDRNNNGIFYPKLGTNLRVREYIINNFRYDLIDDGEEYSDDDPGTWYAYFHVLYTRLRTNYKDDTLDTVTPWYEITLQDKIEGNISEHLTEPPYLGFYGEDNKKRCDVDDINMANPLTKHLLLYSIDGFKDPKILNHFEPNEYFNLYNNLKNIGLNSNEIQDFINSIIENKPRMSQFKQTLNESFIPRHLSKQTLKEVMKHFNMPHELEHHTGTYLGGKRKTRTRKTRKQNKKIQKKYKSSKKNKSYKKKH